MRKSQKKKYVVAKGRCNQKYFGYYSFGQDWRLDWPDKDPFHQRCWELKRRSHHLKWMRKRYRGNHCQCRCWNRRRHHHRWHHRWHHQLCCHQKTKEVCNQHVCSGNGDAMYGCWCHRRHPCRHCHHHQRMNRNAVQSRAIIESSGQVHASASTKIQKAIYSFHEQPYFKAPSWQKTTVAVSMT